MGRSSLLSISWLRHQMFYPYVTISVAKVTIYATQCRRFLSFSFFLGLCEAAKDSSCASSKKNEKKEHLEEPSDLESLCMVLWSNWPLNASFKGCSPWTGTQLWHWTVYNKPRPLWFPLQVRRNLLLMAPSSSSKQFTFGQNAHDG